VGVAITGNAVNAAHPRTPNRPPHRTPTPRRRATDRLTPSACPPAPAAELLRRAPRGRSRRHRRGLRPPQLDREHGARRRPVTPHYLASDLQPPTRQYRPRQKPRYLMKKNGPAAFRGRPSRCVVISFASPPPAAAPSPMSAAASPPPMAAAEAAAAPAPVTTTE